ncbi:MAG: hypothetical protein PHS66_01570 [Candidatus Omnitrophica bacterium]|nr:hypothetical protein [Candidatus Omnitrophota bacterium]
MNTKQIIVILIVSMSLLFLVNLFAQEPDGDTQKSERLDRVYKLLQNYGLSKEQRAELLYEQSYILLTTFWVTSLRTGTEIILKAIEMSPQNKEYQYFLCQAYDNLWKDRDFSDNGEFSEEFQVLKEKVRVKVEQYINEEV